MDDSCRAMVGREKDIFGVKMSISNGNPTGKLLINRGLMSQEKKFRL